MRFSQYLKFFFFFLHPQIADFQIVVSLPNTVLYPNNHTSVESLFIQLSDDVYISV